MKRPIGEIYVIRCLDSGLYKIGFTERSPLDRLRELRYQPVLLPWPNAFELFVSFPGTMQLEKRIHRILDPARVRGEWFSLNQEQILFIPTLFPEIASISFYS